MATIIKRFVPLLCAVQIPLFPMIHLPSYNGRLEAATSRIEDLANVQGFQYAPKAEDPRDEPSPNSYIAPPQSPPPTTPPAATALPEAPRSIVAFDEIVIEGKLKPFLELTRSFAGASVLEIVGELICDMVLGHLTILET